MASLVSNLDLFPGALMWKAGGRPVVGWHWQEPTHTCLLPPWRPGLLRLNHLGRSRPLVIKSEMPSAQRHQKRL